MVERWTLDPDVTGSNPVRPVMCVISVIMEYGRDRIPLNEWTPEKLEAWRELMRQAEKVDLILNQPHCEDPSKTEWFEAVRVKTNIVGQILRNRNSGGSSVAE